MMRSALPLPWARSGILDPPLSPSGLQDPHLPKEQMKFIGLQTSSLPTQASQDPMKQLPCIEHFHGARYWAEHFIRSENNRSPLPGSAVSTFPGLSSFNPQNSPETGRMICPPPRTLSLRTVIQTHPDTRSPAVTLAEFELNLSASKTHVSPHQTT